jgi:hypothetical protein
MPLFLKAEVINTVMGRLELFMNIAKFGRAQQRPQCRHLTGHKFENSLQTRLNRGTSCVTWNGAGTWCWDRNLSGYCDEIRDV